MAGTGARLQDVAAEALLKPSPFHPGSEGSLAKSSAISGRLNTFFLAVVAFTFNLE